MRRLAGWLGFLLLVAAAAVVFFKIKYPTYRWHQKITVTVSTPQGEKSGSAVSAIEWSKGFNWSMGWNHEFKGEAVVVDLDDGLYLFALLRRGENYEWLGTVAPASISGQRGRPLFEDLFQEVAGRRGRAADTITVPDYQYPFLVTFTDINDPTSVQRVDPHNLAAVFGTGYTLKAITLAITGEKVTEGWVESVLKWLLDPVVMKRPSWTALPIESRHAIGALLTQYPELSRAIQD